MTTSPEIPPAPLRTAGILAGLFAFLTLMVAARTPIRALDEWIAGPAALAPESDAWFAALSVTEIGGGATVIPVMLVISLMLARGGEWRLVIPQWGGFLLSRLMTDGLKQTIGRERMAMPDLVEILAHAGSSSFPSGHATSAMAVYGFVAYLVLRSSFPAAARWLLAGLLAGVIVAVAASRMLLGVHYLSDVIGGLLSGGLALALAMAAADRLQPGR